MHTEDNGLKKEIGLLFALTLVIGTIIGSGVFMKPGAVLAYSGDSKMALFAWLLSGILDTGGRFDNRGNRNADSKNRRALYVP